VISWRTSAPKALRLGAVAVFVVAQYLSPPRFGWHGAHLVVTALTVAMAAINVGGFLYPDSRPKDKARLRLAVAIVTIILGVMLDGYSPAGPALGAVLWSVAMIAIRHPIQQSLPVGFVALLSLVVSGRVEGDLNRGAGLCLAVCGVFLAGYAGRQRKLARTAATHEAVLAERTRIAREIHDVLAHSLSAQIVHLESAKLLLRNERAEEAEQRVDLAREMAKRGLEEARRAVSALREDQPPLLVALKELVEEFAADTEQPCALDAFGNERFLSPEITLTLIRTAQEALTNVRRHAAGVGAKLHVGFMPDAVELDISNPASDAPAAPGGGYGLMGMRERAELLGGSLEAGAVEDGFRVHVRIPT
jgi:signal transduction histidine kinase